MVALRRGNDFSYKCGAITRRRLSEPARNANLASVWTGKESTFFNRSIDTMVKRGQDIRRKMSKVLTHTGVACNAADYPSPRLCSEGAIANPKGERAPPPFSRGCRPASRGGVLFP